MRQANIAGNNRPGVSAEFDPPSAKIGPLFFSLNSYSKLCTLDDRELFNAGRLALPMIYNELSDRFDAVEWGHCFHLIAQTYRKQFQLGKTKVAEEFASGWASGSSIAFSSTARPQLFGFGSGASPRNDLRSVTGAALNQTPELMVHLVSSLARHNLRRGRTTLLLPCSNTEIADGNANTFIETDGGWVLPLPLIIREIASRIG